MLQKIQTLVWESQKDSFNLIPFNSANQFDHWMF